MKKISVSKRVVVFVAFMAFVSANSSGNSIVSQKENQMFTSIAMQKENQVFTSIPMQKENQVFAVGVITVFGDNI